MRLIADIEKDIADCRDEAIALRRKSNRLDNELEEARLADAAANPHPWLGKKVARKARRGYRRGGTEQTLRGTLMVKQAGKYYRGSAVNVGQLVVVTESGLTAYDFDVRSGESPWELDQ